MSSVALEKPANHHLERSLSTGSMQVEDVGMSWDPPSAEFDGLEANVPHLLSQNLSFTGELGLSLVSSL